MSIGSLGIIGGLAGAQLPQRAAETEKAQHDTADQSRAAQAEQRAEQAAGIGQTEEDSQAGERDADGRRPWEERAKAKNDATPLAAESTSPPSLSKDPSGTCGGKLDLVG